MQKLTEVSLPRLKRLQQPTIEICTNPRCITCRTHLTTSPTFKANYHLNRTIYQIRHSFTCQSNNVIYLITCVKCHKQYVGCTTAQLRTRVNQHRSSVNQKQSTFLHKHFSLPSHKLNDLKIQPIDKGTDREDLLEKEKFRICTLRTMAPFGLNSK